MPLHLLMAFSLLGAPKTVEIDGTPVELGARLKTREAVSVLVSAYRAKAGADPVAVTAGYIVSHLPDANYTVKLKVSFWELYTDVGKRGVKSLANRGYAEVVIKNPTPGKKIPWRALLKYVNPDGMAAKFPAFYKPTPFYTTEISFEKSLPGG